MRPRWPTAQELFQFSQNFNDKELIFKNPSLEHEKYFY